MKARRHLFAAIAPFTWGEVVLALEIVAQLHARGDEVCFLAPAPMEVLFRGQRCEYRPLRDMRELWPAIDRSLSHERFDALFLIDISILYGALGVLEIDADFVRSIKVPIIGLDVFDIGRQIRPWDAGEATIDLSPHLLEVERRLIPCPVSRPGGVGCYDSLPLERAPPGTREAVRAKLGLADDEALVFFPLASWQQPLPGMLEPYSVRLGRELPRYLGPLLARLPARARVVSVSREPMAELAAALGSRYRHFARLPRLPFLALLAAADLLVSLNPSATTIGAAAVHGVPVLVGTNSHGGASGDEVLAKLPFQPSAAARRWLREFGALLPFRLWPLGFWRFLAPLFVDNPYTTILHGFEIFDEEGFAVAAQRLLDDEATREQSRASAASYVATIRQLPSATTVIDRHLGA